MRVPDPASVLVGKVIPNQIVHSKLDGLLRCNTNQLRDDTRVQAGESFIPDDLSCTIQRVVVQSLTNTRRPLVLHTGLDQVNGVNHERTKRTRKTAKRKVVRRFQHAEQNRLGVLCGLLRSGRSSLASNSERGAP